VDPGLATGVLRAANSSFFQRGTEITSLTQAVTRLGFKEVASLALTLGVGRSFVGGGPFVAQRALLWRRSLVTGYVARVLAGTRRLDAEECFGSGLFASLGSVVGLLGLEVLLKERGNLPTQPWAWWLRLIDVFAAELGETVAERWSLPSLVGSVVRHPFSGSVPPPMHGDVVGAIQVARDVAARALALPRVDVDDLDAIAGLDDIERELVVNALPEAAAMIAAFDAGLPRATSPSVDGIADVPPPARPLAAATVVPSAGRVDVVGLAGDSLVIEGPEAFDETTLVSLEIEVEPRLRLWATTTRTAPSARGHKNQLAPFALDEATYRRWRLLAADQAAERTRQTLKAMETGRR
jgi:HD-like signal output (HDOD) protein